MRPTFFVCINNKLFGMVVAVLPMVLIGTGEVYYENNTIYSWNECCEKS